MKSRRLADDASVVEAGPCALAADPVMPILIVTETACQPDTAPLSELRREIDAVDDDLLKLLQRRATLSRRVGACKRGGDRGQGIYRPERERQIVDRLADHSEAMGGDLPAAHIGRIWREIFSSSRALQRPLSVAFLGPEGTFSHMAAVECLGGSAEVHPEENFYDVFRAVHDGRCDFGLVPLENSLHGTVGQNFDLFAGHAVHIVGEHYSRITHCLMSGEYAIKNVRRVFSHPQPLGQCSAWLRVHLPGVPLLSGESTAVAARRALTEPGAAAIGHPDLAGMLGLNILARGIEDSSDNWTRFALIAPGAQEERARSVPGVEDATLKTSLLFTMPDKPGSLARVLTLLDRAGINMSKLESRPLRDAAWQYVFFADICCDVLRPEHAATMATLSEVCQSVRVLGVYPASAPRY